jgi:hypothetical protein
MAGARSLAARAIILGRYVRALDGGAYDWGCDDGIGVVTTSGVLGDVGETVL